MNSKPLSGEERIAKARRMEDGRMTSKSYFRLRDSFRAALRKNLEAEQYGKN